LRTGSGNGSGVWVGTAVGVGKAGVESSCGGVGGAGVVEGGCTVCVQADKRIDIAKSKLKDRLIFSLFVVTGQIMAKQTANGLWPFQIILIL
jgi:hypothetical protein